MSVNEPRGNEHAATYDAIEGKTDPLIEKLIRVNRFGIREEHKPTKNEC